jgi:hypothetical protein
MVYLVDDQNQAPIFLVMTKNLALPCMFTEMLASRCSIIQLLTCYCHSWAIPALFSRWPVFTRAVWMHTYDIFSVAAPVHIPSVSYCCFMLPC